MCAFLINDTEPSDSLFLPIGDLTPEELERLLLNVQSCALVSTPFFPEAAPPRLATT